MCLCVLLLNCVFVQEEEGGGGGRKKENEGGSEWKQT